MGWDPVFKFRALPDPLNQYTEGISVINNIKAELKVDEIFTGKDLETDRYQTSSVDPHATTLSLDVQTDNRAYEAREESDRGSLFSCVIA